VFVFDDQDRLIERKFLDTQNKLVDHKTWQIAIFKYSYSDQTTLNEVTSFNALGEKAKPKWNPAH